MPATLTEWDARHRVAAQGPPAEPASIVRELMPLLPRGPALDIACGTGRHTLLLASHGHPVTAIDWSPAALEILEIRAREAHLAVQRNSTITAGSSRSAARIQLAEMDLENALLPRESFALILCIQYLQRSMFPQIAATLRPGGAVLFETFTRAQLSFAGGPRNPEYLLEPGKLRTAFPGLDLVFYRELCAGQGIASLFAQKPPRNI
jgi:SAM-dependent methyltransferase